MSDFGDYTDDDALDTEPADPEQVAIRIYRWRQENESLPDWDELTDAQKLVAISIIVRLFAWLRRQGAFR